jgi:hypothetical protein
MSDRAPAPLRLSDDELEAVFTAARPIAVRDRDAFLQRVASALRDCGEVGPGSAHRAIQIAQKEFFDPPEFANGRWAKYR